MSRFLSVEVLERRLNNGKVESLQFKPGVNLLLGLPNSGKTTWLRMLDFLLGEIDPIEEKLDPALVSKYDSVSTTLRIGETQISVERRWKEAGAKSKIYIDKEALAPKDFQHRLLEMLGTPLLHFPKGNPYSGQTWPELSFRMLLRHFYRQQRYWGDITDQQPESERTACVLQFLGLAEFLFTEEYGQLVAKKIELDLLRARREQFNSMLNEVAREVLADPAAQTAVTPEALRTATERIAGRIDALQQRRDQLIAEGRDKAIPPDTRQHIVRLSEQRAELLARRDDIARKGKETDERLAEVTRYRQELADELERLRRASDASTILADLKVTHCPACDQPLPTPSEDTSTCRLCHQPLPDSTVEGLASTRLEFERERLRSEVSEAEELLAVLAAESKRIRNEIQNTEALLLKLDNELRPARTAVSALVQEAVSAVDMELGELSERQRQIGRIKAAFELGLKIAGEITVKETEIQLLERIVQANQEKVDFNRAADWLAEGMNDYLNGVNRLRPKTWKHSQVGLRLGQAHCQFRVGEKYWSNALGGTDQLYFLMAYQYGLSTLSPRDGLHYPGFTIIDIPGEFAGESIRDLENFIVEPYIELLSKKEMKGAQVIITGAAFQGLDRAYRIALNDVWSA